LPRPKDRPRCRRTPIPAVEIVADQRISSSTRHYVLTASSHHAFRDPHRGQVFNSPGPCTH
jgi:hypothetical protein